MSRGGDVGMNKMPNPQAPYASGSITSATVTSGTITGKLNINGQMQIYPNVSWPKNFIPPIYSMIGMMVVENAGLMKMQFDKCSECGATVNVMDEPHHTNWHAKMFVTEETLRLLRTGMSNNKE